MKAKNLGYAIIAAVIGLATVLVYLAASARPNGGLAKAMTKARGLVAKVPVLGKLVLGPTAPGAAPTQLVNR